MKSGLTLTQRNVQMQSPCVLAALQSDGTWTIFETLAEVPAKYIPTQADTDAQASGVAKESADTNAARANAKLQALVAMSPAQVQTWVQANVTTLAQVQDALATLAVAVALLARRL